MQRGWCFFEIWQQQQQTSRHTSNYPKNVQNDKVEVCSISWAGWWRQRQTGSPISSIDFLMRITNIGGDECQFVPFKGMERSNHRQTQSASAHRHMHRRGTWFGNVYCSIATASSNTSSDYQTMGITHAHKARISHCLRGEKKSSANLPAEMLMIGVVEKWMWRGGSRSEVASFSPKSECVCVVDRL